MISERDRRLTEVSSRMDVQEVLTLAPDVAHILQIAASQEDVHERWHAYSALKAVASLYVGYGAQRPELRTSRHYETMIRAIDVLLPDAEGERTA